MEKEEELQWFAMRATYRRELEAKRLLDEKSVENFIPMHYAISIEKGHKVKKLVPVIHNLIFVRSVRSELQQLKQKIRFLQYMTEIRNSKREPIVVPEQQMRQFISVAGTYDGQLVYVRPDDVNLAKGTKVRIHGGVFDGQEGIFVKVKGIRDKRVVVALGGVIAVVIATVHVDLLEVLES